MSCVLLLLAVRLRSSLRSRDQLRQANKRPHSLVSISSSSSSSSSSGGFTAGLLGFYPAGGLGTTPATTQLSTLSTMHESPLELQASVGIEQQGAQMTSKHTVSSIS